MTDNCSENLKTDEQEYKLVQAQLEECKVKKDVLEARKKLRDLKSQYLSIQEQLSKINKEQ